jgi:hypothetical protein
MQKGIEKRNGDRKEAENACAFSALLVDQSPEPVVMTLEMYVAEEKD